MKHKLQLESTRVLLTDLNTSDKWLVEFTGDVHKEIATIFKNEKYQTTYKQFHGHPNKTTAMKLVKDSQK